MKKWIEANFSQSLFLGVAAGLFIPPLGLLPNFTPIILVAGVMFFSCAKIDASQMQGVRVAPLILFYALRFLVLPIALYYLALELIPQYALGVLLVALMPLGAAATAISNMAGGNPTFTLVATVASNVIAPFVIPLIIFAVSGEQVQIESSKLLLTLGSCIFCPALLYFALSKIQPKIKSHIVRNSQFSVTVLLSLMVACVVAYRRDYFFENIAQSLIVFVYVLALYLLLYLAGFIFGKKMNREMCLTYSICSGVNNIAMSAAIAVLYFSSDTVVFTVLGEIAWVVAISLFKKYSLKTN